MRKLRLLSLCTGIGAIDYVWSYQLGQDIAGQVEINPFCTAVLMRHWPHVKRAGDIREVQGDEFGTIDVVAGGIPCQPFSDAGHRRGIEDDRYLWPEMCRLVKKARPRWVLIENVPAFIRLAFDLVAADLESEGYEVGAFVLPACATGAPHIRRRAFIVAHAASGRSQVRQAATRLSTQPHASGALANSSSQRQEKARTRQQAAASFQCGTPLANAHGDRQRIRSGQSQSLTQCEGTAHISLDGTQGALADTDRQRCQERHAAVLPAEAFQSDWNASAGRTDARESESRMGRSLDGAAHWMDSTRWPAPPGSLQHAWEPPRTIPAQRDPDRARRLEALGNAIVSEQIYPFLSFILAHERREMSA